ncbi:MAG TPA: prolyl oligopeptidase family serine peptidase [Acidimicrobiales bacterium]|nr:prolyl oligopeptidase family serine peptidase [Acidimicrobiales bacterium]
MALVTGRGVQHAPLAPSDVAGATVRVGEPGLVGGRLVWLVTPPSSSGNAFLVSGAPGEPVRRESPDDRSVRSRLYGYGAASWCATPLGLVGIESRTQQLCRLAPDRLDPVGAPAPTGAEERLGDPASVPGTSWVVCVRERVAPTGARVALVAIDVATGESVELLGVEGLAAEPAIDVAARSVAWLSWAAGTMPWDDAALCVARLDLDGGRPALRAPRRLDGGRACSAGQPTWLSDGSLAYVTEGAGSWQPWRCDRDGVVRRLSSARVEFQRPRWTTCRWLAASGADSSLVCAYADADGEHVATIDADGGLQVIVQPCVRVDGIAADASSIAWVGATTQSQGAVFLAERADCSTLHVMPAWHAASASAATHPVTGAPEPESFVFVHDEVELAGVRWAPTRHDSTGPPPPLVVAVHPGPTGASDRSYSPLVHLLCANGFAVASVDYSGSTAHGRRHRDRLLGRYGELDVAECTAAAVHLVDAGLADDRAMFIRGTSSGGTTALLALCGDVFAGAVAWYPASRFEDDDHGELGFESGYLAALLGEAGALRSPLWRAGAMAGSVLVVQGADDDVIDPADTARLVARLREHLDDVTSVVVPGEGHGFRTAAGRALALGHELGFYRRLTITRIGSDARYDSSSSGAIEQPGAP